VEIDKDKNIPVQLSIKIEQDIEKSIRTKKYSVGQKLLTENELCEIYSTSRTSVREALNRLKARGLIEIKKGSGAYVTELNSQSAMDLLNLYFEMSNDEDLVYNTIKTRQFFEPEITAQAALNRTSGNIKEFESNLSNLAICKEGDVESETELDRDFHMLITESTGNSVVKIIMQPIFNLISIHRKLVYGKLSHVSNSERLAKTLKFHTDIFNAILNKDSREAFYQMKQSLLDTEKNHLLYKNTNAYQKAT
jgi:GntR family transcriptional regulator, transcriptional repressor for pyruvate dehydrogenase complex